MAFGMILNVSGNGRIWWSATITNNLSKHSQWNILLQWKFACFTFICMNIVRKLHIRTWNQKMIFYLCSSFVTFYLHWFQLVARSVVFYILSQFLSHSLCATHFECKSQWNLFSNKIKTIHVSWPLEFLLLSLYLLEQCFSSFFVWFSVCNVVYSLPIVDYFLFCFHIFFDNHFPQ